MSSYQKFTKNIGIIGSVNFLIVLERIILLPVITKLLGAENYGIWAQLSVTLSLLTPLILLGLPYALIRFLASEKDKRKIQEGIYSVLFLVFVIAFIASLLLIIFSSPLANFLQTPQALIQILAFVILLECLILALLTVLQTFQEVTKYSFFLIFKLFGEIGLIASALFLGFGLYGAVLSLLIIRVITFLLLFVFIFRKFGFKLPTFSPIKAYLRLGLPTVASNVSYWTVTSSDRYLITFFLGVAFVGYYAPAYAIGNILNFLLYPIFFMLPVVLAKAFDENKTDEIKTHLKYSLKYFLMIAIPAVFGMSLLSKQLLMIFTIPEIALNSYFIIPFVALSILLYGVSGFFSEILTLVKKTRIPGIIWVIAALLNIVLNIIFIPLFGILGAAITTLLSYSLAFILICYFASKELQFEIDWNFIFKSVFASVLMALSILWFNPIGLSNTIIAIIFGALLYGILIFLFKGFNQKEIFFLKSFLRK